MAMVNEENVQSAAIRANHRAGKNRPCDVERCFPRQMRFNLVSPREQIMAILHKSRIISRDDLPVVSAESPSTVLSVRTGVSGRTAEITPLSVRHCFIPDIFR